MSIHSRAWPPFALALGLAVLAYPQIASQLTGQQQSYSVDMLLSLAVRHVGLAMAALIPAALVGIGAATLITRPWGKDLKPLTDILASAVQAVPPVVVVALAFPVVGFGALPTMIALVCYTIMPVLRGAVAALTSLPGDVRESALAMGLNNREIFFQIEAPLAFPVIAESLRIAAILAIATAAIGAVAGAATLGTPIIIGLQNQNSTYLLQGAAATGSLAFLIDALFLMVIGQISSRH